MAINQPDNVTYFFYSPSRGEIKIGDSSQPEEREKSLRTACPDGYMIGITHERSTDLYKKFVDYKSAGEWYSCKSYVVNYIENHLGYNPITNREQILKLCNAKKYYTKLVTDYIENTIDKYSYKEKDRIEKLIEKDIIKVLDKYTNLNKYRNKLSLDQNGNECSKGLFAELRESERGFVRPITDSIVSKYEIKDRARLFVYSEYERWEKEKSYGEKSINKKYLENNNGWGTKTLLKIEQSTSIVEAENAYKSILGKYKTIYKP